MKTVNLLTGLQNMIAAVEKLPSNTEFMMGNYANCVIGKTAGWSKDKFGDVNEAATLRKIFGIRKEADEWASYFSEDADHHYTPRTWKVIKLFTTNIFDECTKKQWLKEANKTLQELS
ncbi:hypothetical protein ACX818_001447 [Acinetobacter baumannii]